MCFEHIDRTLVIQDNDNKIAKKFFFIFSQTIFIFYDNRKQYLSIIQIYGHLVHFYFFKNRIADEQIEMAFVSTLNAILSSYGTILTVHNMANRFKQLTDIDKL
ncbi:hypothetical protein LOAG_00415 [Loa loa]|uniref:Uncharacterized protein n=1 Tax=Loa loa TaxID=7209 RepID=A0A1S0UC14_LOALO|nr:hypothetical protein LOAG_00415 [Loa loa]EFO28061.1 hypothetical protein LOAG_00415 [Loa loa]